MNHFRLDKKRGSSLMEFDDTTPSIHILWNKVHPTGERSDDKALHMLTCTCSDFKRGVLCWHLSTAMDSLTIKEARQGQDSDDLAMGLWLFPLPRLIVPFTAIARSDGYNDIEIKHGDTYESIGMIHESESFSQLRTVMLEWLNGLIYTDEGHTCSASIHAPGRSYYENEAKLTDAETGTLDRRFLIDLFYLFTEDTCFRCLEKQVQPDYDDQTPVI